MQAVVPTFNQEKALEGAFSVITNLQMELFEALVETIDSEAGLRIHRDIFHCLHWWRLLLPLATEHDCDCNMSGTS